MKTVEVNLYRFDELSDSAKERAREWYRSSGTDNFYVEYVLDDVADIADLMGIDLRQTLKPHMDKSFHYAPTIYFSGFCSQGDGACFECRYAYKKGSVKAVRAYAPKDFELQRIAKGLQDAQKKHFYKLKASTKHRGHYFHELCMAVDVSCDTYADISASETDITELLRAFAQWIYRQLETEYEYQNSDETVTENIICNEYDFLESGERA